MSRDVVREQIRLSRQRFDDGQPGFYRIALRSAPGETIGFAGLRTYGVEDRVEVLYALKPAYWGQGFATEAADAILERAFEDPNLAAVDAGADPPNVASFRVMRRLGMRLVGEVAIEGAPGPATYYRITREEFASRRRSS